MWIVKLGGSWLLNPRLNELLDYLSNFKNAPISIVVGGGLFAQTIRDSQKVINFSDNLGHHLALLSTENFARILNNINPSYELTSNYRRIYSKRKIQVWLPSKQLTNDLSFSKDWESTSDSIASWLCKKINAKGVIFIKSIKFKKNLELKAKTLQRKGILDKNILKYISKNASLKIVGPEVLDIFKEYDKWSEIVMNLNDVRVN